VWYSKEGVRSRLWSKVARVGCRPSRSWYSTYPLPVTTRLPGYRLMAVGSRADRGSGRGRLLQSAPRGRIDSRMSAEVAGHRVKPWDDEGVALVQMHVFAFSPLTPYPSSQTGLRDGTASRARSRGVARFCGDTAVTKRWPRATSRRPDHRDQRRRPHSCTHVIYRDRTTRRPHQRTGRQRRPRAVTQRASSGSSTAGVCGG